MNDIIVVGNGPSVVDAKKGQQIDAHKDVVRMNEYYIYDGDTTGVRTTIWAPAKDFHHWKLYKTGKNFAVDWTEVHTVLYMNRTGTDRCDLVKKQAADHNARFVFVPEEHRQWLIGEYKKGYNKKAGPSAGLTVLSYYIDYLKTPLDCIGFDGLDSYRMHYFDNARCSYFHPPEIEKRFINNWIEKGMLKKL